MNASILRVPASLADDPSDVAVALEVAGALWDKGDREEAIRWVRRAVEAAGEAGDAPRAAFLTEAAGELEAAAQSSRNGEPPAAEPAAQVAPFAPFAGPAPPPAVVRQGIAAATADGARVRVSVKTSIRDPNLLLLRRLSDGQAPPPGTREGFLVVAESAADAKALSNGGRTT